MKYILVTGGVISGIGKGVIASSTGLLLRTRGLRVTSIKIDPYLNIDAGTLSPLDHGEVFVLDDGGEVDLDLGNYERFLDITLTRENNITTGKIYKSVIERERRGDYLGKTVQVVPHITDAIQEWVERVARVPVDDSGEEPDVCIIELGGTVGDIESAPFVEAMRQFHFRVGHSNFCLIHVSLIPVVGSVGEQKTKPTQASVRDLRGLGLSPDLIACRSSKQLDEDVKEKIAMFCHVEKEHVMAVHDCQSVYHVPLLLDSQGLVTVLEKRLNLQPRRDSRSTHLHSKWKELTVRHDRLFDVVKIVLVGKYTHLKDSYISVVKALEHAALACSRKLKIEWVEASELEPAALSVDPIKYHEAWKVLVGASGILVPGGFGERGSEGKIAAAKWARENKVPYLGICLGMQIAVIEFARNVCGLTGANSAELDKDTPHPVVINMPEISATVMGGTMRLGDRTTNFTKDSTDSITRRLYGGANTIHERHRHRYEINPEYINQIEKAGLDFIGKDEKGERMIMIELKDHPFFVGTQYHPEYKTRPLKPTPVFLGFILAAAGLLPEYLANIDTPENRSLGRYPSVHDNLDAAAGPEATADASLARKGEAVNGIAPEVVATGISIEKDGKKV
ncbi:CTP synthase N-terminus-domain-containing protein [Fimicolochytrium jonesii]|uniref:CTP synthase N-terminus-domain-containing protein n=1 Tax=Fimicolochytrium jonesii TaxID=1396493 RepID=UPI0022FEE413|nr:CTP synthase N-terminus-domain-containing protein [Fimicolochytrium jonesii]KAI8823462.1 CTP synthase N-terminus-domain-containing protein [Fimicolochytrium jonesii]